MFKISLRLINNFIRCLNFKRTPKNTIANKHQRRLRYKRGSVKPNYLVYKQRGVTLLEMLITIAILAILVSLVGPSIQSILIKNRITADINTLSAAAQTARFNAVNEQQNVRLCPTSNYTQCESSWRYAKMVFIDKNDNQQRDTDEPLIASSDSLNRHNEIYGISGAITFDAQGAISTNATITICPDTNDANYASALLLSLYGRISAAVDTDNDGKKEDLSGNSLTCS